MGAPRSSAAPVEAPVEAQGSETEEERLADALLRSAVGGSSAPRRRARFHSLEVAEVRPLTDDAIEVVFAVPGELAGEFDYLPGQHVALRHEIEGREVRRSYSLCRMPDSATGEGPGTVSVAIKRDRGGLFSTWAHEHLRPGVRIDVMSPQGTFTTRLADLDGAHVAAVAAGSGITPLMALATAVLGRSETARFTLLCTNRSARDVMFLEELADLKDRYPARFALLHVLTREQRSVPLLSGRLDEEKLRAIFERLIVPATIDEWFLCGPMELVQLCRDVLADSGVAPARIRYELFTADREEGVPSNVGAPRGPVATREEEQVIEIAFTLDGQSTTVRSPASAKESVLSAALRVRADTPFACAGGVCGTCRALLVSGSVSMAENYALEPAEIERGFVLTCQSHPSSDRVVVDYDV